MEKWVVDLAPRHKLGLPVSTRVLAGPGMTRLGFPQQMTYAMTGVGAIVIGPWTGYGDNPRYPVLYTRGGGVFWVPPRPPRNTRVTLQRLAAAWHNPPVPFIASLGPHDTTHVRDVARHLGECALVSGILVEVGEEEEVGAVVARISTAADVSELPVWVALPTPRVSDLAEVCVRAGVDALVIAMPETGMWMHRGVWVAGYVYGPVLLPRTLAALREVRSLVGDEVPVIALGGIHSPEDALLCRAAGADAVMLDTALWVDPDLPARVWEALRDLEEEEDVEP